MFIDGKFVFTATQTKFPKVMFLHLSISHSVHRGWGLLPDGGGGLHPERGLHRGVYIQRGSGVCIQEGGGLHPGEVYIQGVYIQEGWGQHQGGLHQGGLHQGDLHQGDLHLGGLHPGRSAFRGVGRPPSHQILWDKVNERVYGSYWNAFLY